MSVSDIAGERSDPKKRRVKKAGVIKTHHKNIILF